MPAVPARDARRLWYDDMKAQREIQQKKDNERRLVEEANLAEGAGPMVGMGM